MKCSVIYKIQSTIKPERVYVGSAASFKDRKSKHLTELRKNIHGNQKLQNHFNKYGEGDLVFTIIEPCLKYSLIEREQFYIDSLKPFFNICKRAGNSLGRLASEETKAKMRNRKPWNKGKKTGPLSDATRLRMSISRTGSVGPWKGKKLSSETKRKMSESQKRTGNKPPSWLGKKHKDSTREKLSKIKKEFYAK